MDRIRLTSRGGYWSNANRRSQAELGAWTCVTGQETGSSRVACSALQGLHRHISLWLNDDAIRHRTYLRAQPTSHAGAFVDDRDSITSEENRDVASIAAGHMAQPASDADFEVDLRYNFHPTRQISVSHQQRQ
jgi:hypothetical protein